MNSAGKRESRNPDRYNPSQPYPPPTLLSTNFDITISEADDDTVSINPSLQVIPL